MGNVAKSYQGLSFVSEPYEKNKKMYIDVLTKNGATKTVRWYSDKEYAKLYPEEKVVPKSHCNQRNILGFKEAGYITVVHGKTIPHEKWLSEHHATYTRFWGWSFASNVEVPQEFPNGLVPCKLEWKDVGNDDGSVKPEAEVLKFMRTQYKIVPTCSL